MDGEKDRQKPEPPWVSELPTVSTCKSSAPGLNSTAFLCLEIVHERKADPVSKSRSGKHPSLLSHPGHPVGLVPAWWVCEKKEARPQLPERILRTILLSQQIC